MERGVRAAVDDTALPGNGGLPDEFQIVHFPCVFTATVTRLTLRCNVFVIFPYPSHLKHLVLRANEEDCLPEMLSKLGVLAERCVKK